MDSQADGLLQQVIERASKDAGFRQALVADAKGTLEREYGVQMPANINLQVVEESPSARYLVLPPRQVAAGSDLSDAELEGVAGGWTGQSECGTCAQTCGPGPNTFCAGTGGRLGDPGSGGGGGIGD